MKQRDLGNTGISVTPLGLGVLTLGPFQLNFPVEVGARLIVESVRRGINILDTAKAYRVYPYMRESMKQLAPEEKRQLHVIARSYDYTYRGARESFLDACHQMGLDEISIYMLHEMESEKTLSGHKEAIKCLQDLKTEKKIRAVGISTHYVAAVRAAINHPEIDVIFAILNLEGIGIMDGTREEMEEVLKEAHNCGKGILLMKVFGGGHLYREARQALEYAKSLSFVDSTIIGMQDIEEVEYNISIFDKDPKADILPFLPRKKKRRLLIEPWCSGCGECLPACPFKALSIEGGKASVDYEKCMLCTYCAGKCPGFCIKVV